MMQRRLSLLVSLTLMITALLSTGSAAAQGTAPDEAALQAPAAVLYDQINNASTRAVTAQNFEAGLNTFDSEAADDFVVPSGLLWTITSVEVLGRYEGASARVASSANVRFYNHSGASLPNTLVYDASFVPSGGLNDGNFVINLSPAASLFTGTYWVSVQANLDFNPDGRQWQWIERTVQSGNAAAFRNPGGDVSPGICTSWGTLS
ncbi:MAG: hypothetical protein ACREOH_15200, partial [Candidatus Entotheonellia bacterium]